jgi:NADH:ubiquinone oxidoreductase subunit F (NADH-binding)/ferredoxin
MDRRLSDNADTIRFRIDATRCDGQGVCVLVAPELFGLDRYGLGYVLPGADQLAAADPEVRAHGLEADAMCPRNAIREEPAPAPRPDPAAAAAPLPAAAFVPRLVTPDASESLADWRSRGGYRDRTPGELLDLATQAGLAGHGGAGFPTAAKWRHVIGADQPFVVANGAEREPGTSKDRYLMAHRPFAVLDGLRLAMLAVGARVGYLCIDEDAYEAADRMAAALDEARADGLLDDIEIRFHRVPARYVAGEETALLSSIEGFGPVPRIRPPYPAEVGLFGRATLVQNVETLAQLAVAAVLGPAEYRAAGTPDSPGSGIFTVGPFGGDGTVTEVEFGRTLASVLDSRGLLGGVRAVLVGGYAGGLLTPDQLDVALTPAALRAAGASLGTKSVQVLGPDDCPVGAVASIVRYFGEQTAEQCPPCHRGLPDMAAILDDLEKGTADAAALDDLEQFMATLSGRGVCRLPDGAARIVSSLLTSFADVVTAHANGGCQDAAGPAVPAE